MKSIIWNLTRFCPWTCQFCCVAAQYVPNFKRISLNDDKKLSYPDELSYEEKKKVIDQLHKGDFRIDFSGGDLLIDPLNLELVLYASEKLGRENVGISVSGAFINDEVVRCLKDKISDVEITLDYLPFTYYQTRPVGYHEYASNAIQKLRAANIEVGVQTVITNENIHKEKMFQLYQWLKENDVNTWSLLRFFQSGRGMNFGELEPSHSEYCKIVDYIKEINQNEQIKVHFQYLLPNHEGYTLDCRAVKKSIGILPNGLVTGCFWGLDSDMKPIDKKYELGKVPDMNLYDILNNNTSKYWSDKEHKCEIFTYEWLEHKS